MENPVPPNFTPQALRLLRGTTSWLVSVCVAWLLALALCVAYIVKTAPRSEMGAAFLAWGFAFSVFSVYWQQNVVREIYLSRGPRCCDMSGLQLVRFLISILGTCLSLAAVGIGVIDSERGRRHLRH